MITLAALAMGKMNINRYSGLSRSMFTNEGYSRWTPVLWIL